MSGSHYGSMLVKYRKQSLGAARMTPAAAGFGQDTIKQLIPHREPFLLLDRIQDVDLSQGLIFGTRYIHWEDPVFIGHFPDFPVYPGCLQVEMIGQLGLCLYGFMRQGGIRLPQDIKPLRIRATKVLGAQFLEPLLPGQNAELLVKKLEQGPLLGTAIGQVMANGKICTVAAWEVCFLE